MFLAQINLQEESEAALQEGANLMEEADTVSMSFWELVLKGGPIMAILFLLSLIAVYIFVERYYVILKAGKEETNFMNRIREYIHDSKIEAAQSLCLSTESPVSRMVQKGINRIGRPLADVNAAIENVGKLEVAKMEKGLPTLATIAGAAPMIGFLGTVIGMIIAFYDMANAGNNIDITLLSRGIYTAMVTTVAGLIIGILAYFAYNTLVVRVEKLIFKLEATSTEFMDLLYEPVN